MSRSDRMSDEFADENFTKMRKKTHDSYTSAIKEQENRNLLQRARLSRHSSENASHDLKLRQLDYDQMSRVTNKSHSTDTGASTSPMHYLNQVNSIEDDHSKIRKHKKIKKNMAESKLSGSDSDSSVNKLVQNLENTEEKLIEKYNELDEQNKDLIYYNRRTKHEIDDLKKEVAHLKTQLEVTLKNELHLEERKAKELERKLVDAKQIFENSAKFRSKEIDEMRKRLEIAQTELAEADTDNKTLKSKCGVLEDKILELQDNISVRKEHEDILLKNMSKILMERDSRLSNESNINSDVNIPTKLMSSVSEEDSSGCCKIKHK